MMLYWCYHWLACHWFWYNSILYSLIITLFKVFFLFLFAIIHSNMRFVNDELFDENSMCLLNFWNWMQHKQFILISSLNNNRPPNIEMEKFQRNNSISHVFDHHSIIEPSLNVNINTHSNRCENVINQLKPELLNIFFVETTFYFYITCFGMRSG